MSDINKLRVKQIRPSSGGGLFADPYPLGTDGQFIDMASGLDLEQENRIGGNCYINVVENNYQTIITEYYFSEPKGSRSLQEMINGDKVTYRIVHRINTPYGEDNFLIDDLMLNNYITNENGDHILVGRSGSDSMTIHSSLYKGSQQSNSLHDKTITFDYSSTSVNIDEQIDIIGGNS